MALTIHSEQVPLRVDDQGVVRVGGSQVLLDVVVREYNNGAEPDAIAHGFPTLDLADVHAAIAYYLRHRREVDDYLEARRHEADSQRREIESHQPARSELRERLLARKARMEIVHAESDQR